MVTAKKEPLEIPWERVVPYQLACVCEIDNPPAMRDYFAVFMAAGQQATIMFPLSKS